MNTSQFLSLIWPEEGPYLIAIPVQWRDKETQELKKGFRHFPHETALSAATHAAELATDRDAPKDVYFALGSVVDVDAKRKRHASNIDRVRAFWLDIDIKADPRCYPTLPEAATALRQFCKSTGLPKPYIVGSGGGIHCYWPMTESIEADQWQHYASILKALTKSHKLLVDQTRTADRASVLRPVGTYNWKTGDAREVKLLTEGKVLTPKQLMGAIARAGDGIEVQEHKVSRIESNVPEHLKGGEVPAHLRGGAEVNAAATQGITAGYTEADPRRVFKACQQLRRHVEAPNTVSEPEWYAMIGCIRHAKRGADAVHMVSKLYDGYTFDQTEAKIAQHEAGGFGPTLCATFEEHNPGGCDGCPFKDKVKTPLLLGRERVELETPKLKISNDEGITAEIELPDPPRPYKRALNVDTGKACIVMQMFTDLEVVDEMEIFPFDIYPSKLMYDEREGRYQVGVTLWLPHRGDIEFYIPTGLLYDRRGLATLLGNKGALPDLSKVEHLVQYMVAYIRELQKRSAGSTVYAQLGWQPDGSFVLPDQRVTTVGSQALSPSEPVENAIEFNRHPPMGDLEAWKKIVATYERPGFEALQFAFGVGFGAPLLQFTQFYGMVVSVWGEAGTGKSTAAMCANSIWGHQKLGWVDIEQDTMKAFYNKIGVLNNLPVTQDEITNVDPSDLSDMCYSVTNGRGRQRLKQDGTARESFNSWRTMLISTSNASIHSKLTLAKDDSTAEAVRVFEYMAPQVSMSKTEADETFLPLQYNYGLAGPVYAKALVRNRERVAERVTHWIKTVDAAAEVVSRERFWSAGVGCVLAGFELANECGLTNADLDRLLAFAVDTIRSMRTGVKDSRVSSEQAFSEYLNRNMRCVLTLNNAGAAGGPPMLAQEPTQELRIRIEAHNKRMYVDRAHIRRFIAEQKLDPRTVASDLRKMGLLLDDSARVVLGKGTKYRGTQTYCWLIDLDHPAMGESPVKAVDNVQPGVEAS